VKSTVETLSPTRVRLEVEVPFAELEPNVKKAYRTIGSQVNVPGFRKGKVPAAIIDQRIGRGVVLEEAVQNVVPEQLQAAVREHDIKTIGRPNVTVEDIVDKQPLKFTVEVDVRPEITVPDLSGIEVPITLADVTEDEIDEQVTRLRERFATLKTAERPAADGDYVQLDLAATVDGAEVPGGSASNISHEVGSGQLVPGLDEVLVGMAAGDARSFATQLVGGDFAGKDADVAVSVKAVKEKQLPELDDDFAQLASEFDTLDELRSDVRKRMDQSKRLERLMDTRDKALEAVVAVTEIPVPESVVAEESEHRKQQMIERLEQLGASLETFLTTESKTEEELDSDLTEAATSAIRVQLLLDAMADAENLTVTDDEFGAEIMDRAQRAGKAPQQYYEDLLRSGAAGAIFGDVRRGKALALLMERVRIVDADGNVVSVQDLRAGLSAQEDDHEHAHGHDHDHEHDGDNED
jgi:trigger factor